MLWFILSILAALIWSFTNIIDKHVVSDEARDPILLTTVAGFTMFLIFTLFSLVSNPLALPPLTALSSFLAGVFYIFAINLLYRSSEKEEISRVIPIIELNPLIVLVISFAFLGEILSPVKYVGIIILILGTVLVSVKRKTTMVKRSVFAIALMSGFLYAMRNIFLEISSAETLLSVLSWVGLGGLVVGLAFLSKHHPHIRKKAKKGLTHVIIGNILAVIAFFLFVNAIFIGSVSLVTAVVCTNIFFVFVIATILSRSHTHIIKEEMRESTLLLKLAAIVLVFLGLLLII